MIGIVAHADRLKMAEDLADTVKAEYVNVDDGTLGCNANHQHVWDWLATNNHDDWSIVLEDDAIPVEGFRDQLDAALSAASTPIVSLYLGTGRPLHWQPRVDLATNNANSIDASWIVSNELIHAVGIAIHTDLLPYTDLPDMPIDDAISTWAQHHGHKVGYTWPSLIDHADTSTLIEDHRNQRTARRVARWHAGRVTWTSRSVTM